MYRKELKMENYFEELNKINVNEHVEQKNGLSYLSWAWAWGELKKKHPDATYTIYENKDGLFYHTDGKTAWVKTGVTVNGIEHIEYLPVMDFRNKSIPVENITSFDVNKTIQRSLTKAVARHGIGLYIYAGEDLPEEPQPTPAEKAKATREANKEKIAELDEKGRKYIAWLKGLKREITPEEDIKVKELLRELESFTECREVAKELEGAHADNDKIRF